MSIWTGTNEIFNMLNIPKKISRAIRSFRSEAEDRYKLFPYKDWRGSFDYNQYKKIQEEGNKRKIDKSWVQRENIEFLCSLIGRAQFGICHGTRRGLEQKWFSEILECNVIGTEISDTASNFPNTIQWDFHDDKTEWHGKADFIYSNSLDHAYDPAKALINWMKCLSHDGVCIIEHSSMHEGSSKLDPFGADIEIIPYLILQWANGQFCVTDIRDAPNKPPKVHYIKFLFLKNIGDIYTDSGKKMYDCLS